MGKPDNQLAAAQAEVERINQIGAALREFPEYLDYRKWTSLENAAERSAEKGGTTVILGDVSATGISAAAIAASANRKR